MTTKYGRFAYLKMILGPIYKILHFTISYRTRLAAMLDKNTKLAIHRVFYGKCLMGDSLLKVIVYFNEEIKRKR